MKKRHLFILLVLFLTLVVSVQPVQMADGWEPVAPGIDYQEFLVSGPNNVFVARMDRNNPQATLETSIAQGRLRNGRETVSSMARRYDQAINYWGEAWGSRNKVAVAINGYFFDAVSIWRGQVQSGWYAKRFDDKENGSGFAWTLDRVPFIGECISHPVSKQSVLYATGAPQPFQGINVARGDNQLILYTSHYDARTGTSGGVEVLVEMSTPSMILSNNGYTTGRVVGISTQGNTPIPFDHVVLSASSDAATRLRNNTNIGDEIRIYQDLRNFSEWDCTTELFGMSWNRTYASIGGSFYFLKEGKLQRQNDSGANIRNPRTAIAFNDQYIYFIVVDGRNPGVSVGMTMAELYKFSVETLNATYGINQDGGGSSTMVVNGEVKNIPSDGLARSSQVTATNQVYLPVVGQNGANNTQPPPPEYPIVERQVANGMMMVVVEPKTQSGTFMPGDVVRSLVPADLRLGPGTNYAVLTSFSSPGAVGQIQAHNLAGVLAKGSYWWKVSFDGATGWIQEEALGR